jgi:hypothetical protein
MMEERCIYHIQSKKNIHCQIYHNSGIRNPQVLLEIVKCLDLIPFPAFPFYYTGGEIHNGCE